MKVKVTMQAIIDTEKISKYNTGVKNTIEKSAFNKEPDNLANLWALSEIDYQGADKKISLELL